MRRGRTVLEQSYFDHIKVKGTDGLKQVPKWGKTVEYNPLGPPDSPGVRLNGKTWRGKKEINDGELQSALMTHKQYGIDFIALSEDGGEADLVDSFFDTHPNGSVYCWLTDKTFMDRRGANGHKESNKFKEAVSDYLNEVRRSTY
jgi:hypothetical protein